MEIFESLGLILVGLLAGFIDSIAGGGGLVTVPVFTLLLGPGSTAIGTNKIAGVASSLFALLVYLRGGHVSLRGNRIFAVIVGLSAALGAMASPLVPPPVYQWILVVICPVILFLVVKKDLWIRKSIEDHAAPASRWHLWVAGFVCGFYDGIAGPGGGTLMFLSLLLFARIPLIPAMATAKIANLASASISLTSFAALGHVVWSRGLTVAIGMALGATLGATFATRRAAPIARVALTVVALLLVVRLIAMD